MEFSQKRWIALGAAMMSALLVGIIYSFSVYVNPLIEKFAWTKSSVSLAYTLNIIFTAVVPLCCGSLRAKLKLNQYCLIGGFLYSTGIILCGFIQGSVYEFYLYFGVLTGAGIGFVYTSLATYVVQMFPDRKGMAAGLYTACYGCAPFFWAPLASYLIINKGLNTAFICLGIFFFIGLVIVTRFLSEIPAGFADSLSSAQNAKPQLPSVYEKTPKELLTTPLFYIVMILYTCGMSSGSMALSLGSPILQSSLNYTPEKAAIVVGFFAVASATGRLFWGFLSDKIGRPNVLICLCIITAVSMVSLSLTTTEGLFISSIILIPLCYGAYACTISPVTVECFGQKNFTMNYTLVFQVFAFSAVIGPQVIALSELMTGSFQAAFKVAVGLAICGLVMGIILRAKVNSSRAALKNT